VTDDILSASIYIHHSALSASIYFHHSALSASIYFHHSALSASIYFHHSALSASIYFHHMHCLLLFLYYNSLSDSTVDIFYVICPLCFESTYCGSLILR
jgi:hypothetical protein